MTLNLLLGLTLLLSATHAIKVYNLIPTYCSDKLELRTKAPEIELKRSNSENGSFVQIGASIIQGINIGPNYKCFVVVHSPPGSGLVLTVRKASLNDHDLITFKSGNSERSWKQRFNEDDTELESNEIVAEPNPTESASISIKYEPTVGDSPFNAGFDLAVTSFKVKSGDECDAGLLDCGNDRCIARNLRCDGYNNCGNHMDEDGCAGVSWFVIALLIVVAIIVVILALLVWIRMSRN